MRSRSRRRWGLVAALPLLLAPGCGSSDAGADGIGDQRTLTVYAAASLTAAAEELAEEFEARHDGVRVQLNLAGSSDLAAQIEQGAPADVFASADAETMDALETAGLLAGEPAAFATNTLQIAVPPGNPAHVRSLPDLAGGDVAVVVCAPVVPCGRAARAVADAAGVWLSPVSEEQSVTDVLGKVSSGEADAGLVYITDVLAAGGRVEGIPIRGAAAGTNTYPAAVVRGAERPRLAERFVGLLTGPTGQRVLRDLGFGPA